MSARQRSIGAGAVFLLAFGFFAALFHKLPVLYDTDSYYHLAIARAYHRHGLIDSLPWAQLSLLHEFGDKEFLFHLLLAPVADTAPPTAGGRWALAALNALVAGALAYLGSLAAGRWGFALPALVYLGSLDFLSRMIRLRPELLSLLLLLAALWCAARGRDRWLGVVAALYALSYTAFHAFLGLCAAWFFHQLWTRGRREWGWLLYPTAGVGLGLVLHPQFPHNLTVWKVQTIDFFAHKASLNVGAEILPQTTERLLVLNLAWALGLYALWRAAVPRGARSDHARFAELASVAAVVFGGLHLLMQRFAVYSVPFLTLAVVFELRRRGAVIGRSVALPGRGRVPLALALGLVLAFGVWRTGDFLSDLAGGRGVLTREGEWATFGRALRPGARVASEWGSTHVYMFWAPQATYLNVLDPVFMKVPYPRAYAALRAVFDGRDPDVPRTLLTELGCDHVALSSFHPAPRLLDRLRADPRLRLRHHAYTLLYELVPDANDRFVLDWTVPEPGRPAPGAAYPRDERPELRAVEGYVDATRVAAGECVTLEHALVVETAQTRRYELAPWGPTAVWLDGEPVAGVDAGLGAVLGRGIDLALRLEPGIRRLRVRTCPAGGRAGFYLLTASDSV